MNHAEWMREWNKLQRQEYEFLAKGRFQKQSKLNQFIEKKVPDNLQDKLDAAFSKAFALVFQKGTGIIEKTYDKEGITQHYENMVDDRNGDFFKNRKGLRYFAKKAGSSKKKNLVFSGASGIGLGVLGVGIPDIALFTGTMLKGIYEIATHFGYAYDTEQEKYFILRIVETALLHGKELDDSNDDINQWLEEPFLPEGYEESLQITKASGALSKELLYMKFLQGITLVGAIGGAYDPIYLGKILRYAELKYHRRFLYDLSKTPNSDDIA